MPSKVPAVIKVEDDAVSIVSEIGSRRSQVECNDKQQLAVLNGRRIRVLPDSNYKQALDSIIQRDYFPNQLYKSTQNSVRTSDTATTLTGFHAKAASDRQVEFQLTLDQDAADQRTYVETTKYNNTCAKQNPVFFPVVPRNKTKNQLELAASTSVIPYSSNHDQSIVPAATRFPPLKPKVPQHWETDTVDDGSSNGFTDLDSTIVLSLRSEIRRGKLQKRKQGAKSVGSSRRRTVRPPLDSEESIGYALRKAYKRPRKSSSASSTTSSVRK